LKKQLSRLFGGYEDYEYVKQIDVSLISPSPYQPRTVFDDEKIDELCQTISSYGIIQPIIVRKKENDKGYELIAGERRLRAAKKLKLAKIPAIVKEMDKVKAASVSLIENLQREGLSVIEEALAYQKLMKLYNITQEKLALKLGKSQSTIANKMRLLQLPAEIKESLLAKEITERHARALLSLKTKEQQLAVFQDILQKKLTVKETEEYVKKILEKDILKQKKSKRKSYSKDMRIAINTIKQSIKMVKDTGLKVSFDEKEEGNFYELVIRLEKNIKKEF